MKKILLCGLVVVMVAVLIFAGCAKAGPAPGGKIEMKWVSFLPSQVTDIANIQKYFVDVFNEQANGKAFIDYAGGPEAIAAFDQGKAVQDGIVDMSVVPVGFYEPLVPGNQCWILSNVSLEEERNGGAVDYMQEIHEKAGLYYVGRGIYAKGGFFTTIMKKKVETKDDFTKVKIAASSSARAPIMGWGAAYVSCTPAEFYTVLERGVADGLAGVPETTIESLGVYEVGNYIIDHPYFQNSLAVLMNLNTWNKLPKKLQDLMTETMIEAEKQISEIDYQDRSDARQVVEAAGIEFYKLAPDIADWYIETAYKSGWEYQEENFPEVTAKMKSLISK